MGRFGKQSQGKVRSDHQGRPPATGQRGRQLVAYRRDHFANSSETGIGAPMNPMQRIRFFSTRIVNLFRRSTLESDLTEQLEVHRQMIKDDLIERGMEPSQAERKARKVMGNDVMVVELARDEMFARFIDEGIRDIRHGFRSLAQHKAFATVAAISLSIGIGANTFIFSLTNSTLLNPLGYPAPERLVTIWTVPDRHHKLNPNTIN